MKQSYNFFIKKIISVLVLATIATGMLAGCSIGDKTVYFDEGCADDEVFKIGEYICTEGEFKAYLLTYYNLYGTVCDVNLWSGEFDTETIETSIKDAVFSHIVKVYVLNVYAELIRVTLTDSDESLIAEAAAELYSSLTSDEIAYIGLSEEEIITLYERYILAEKVYAALMEEVDTDVSEDEARIMDAYILHTTDADLAAEIQSDINNGATFERLASSYNEDQMVSFCIGRGTYDSAIEAVVFNLEDDEVSEMITTDDGYYFFQCVNKYNEELSEANKQAIISERQTEAMDACLESMKDLYYSELNQSCFDQILVPSSGNVTTSALFTTLNSYISY